MTTILKERLILEDIERELIADTFLQFDRTYAVKKKVFATEYVKTRVPWVMRNAPITQTHTLQERCVDVWQKYKEIKGIED